MTNDSNTARIADCKVCYVQHSDDIHDATIRIRHWLRQEVTRKLSDGLDTGVAVGDQVLVAQIA